MSRSQKTKSLGNCLRLKNAKTHDDYMQSVVLEWIMDQEKKKRHWQNLNKIYIIRKCISVNFLA